MIDNSERHVTQTPVIGQATVPRQQDKSRGPIDGGAAEEVKRSALPPATGRIPSARVAREPLPSSGPRSAVRKRMGMRISRQEHAHPRGSSGDRCNRSNRRRTPPASAGDPFPGRESAPRSSPGPPVRQECHRYRASEEMNRVPSPARDSAGGTHRASRATRMRDSGRSADTSTASAVSRQSIPYGCGAARWPGSAAWPSASRSWCRTTWSWASAACFRPHCTRHRPT